MTRVKLGPCDSAAAAESPVPLALGKRAQLIGYLFRRNNRPGHFNGLFIETAGPSGGGIFLHFAIFATLVLKFSIPI
jgi:hypothetical protein